MSARKFRAVRISCMCVGFRGWKLPLYTISISKDAALSQRWDWFSACKACFSLTFFSYFFFLHSVASCNGLSVRTSVPLDFTGVFSQRVYVQYLFKSCEFDRVIPDAWIRSYAQIYFFHSCLLKMEYWTAWGRN